MESVADDDGEAMFDMTAGHSSQLFGPFFGELHCQNGTRGAGVDHRPSVEDALPLQPRLFFEEVRPPVGFRR